MGFPRNTTESKHFHTIEIIAFGGLGAIIVINLARMAAGWAAQREGFIGGAGKAVGALVTFGAHA